jgi:UDP-glucose 4-epimerase
MRCIVTGGAGFIGSNLVDRLVKDGHEVQVWDNLSTGKKENINIRAIFIQCDISRSYDARKQLMLDFKPDVVFHLAAKARVQPSIENPIEFNTVNVNGTLNLLKMSADCGVKRFVYSSSSSVYGNVDITPTPEEHILNPLSPYALQKLIGEQYCKLYSELYDIETVCLRYFNVYGERQLLEGAYCLVMGIFAQQRLNNEPMTIRGDGEQRRDFTYVGDVVDANIKAGFNSKIPIFKCEGDVFNIGNGDNRSVNQIADLIGGDRVNVNPVIEPKETLADNNKAYRVLGWKPTIKIEDWITKYKEEIGL